MREEVKRIVAEEDAKREARVRAEGSLDDTSSKTPVPEAVAKTASPRPSLAQKQGEVEVAVVTPPTPAKMASDSSGRIWWIVGVLVLLGAGIFLVTRKGAKNTRP